MHRHKHRCDTLRLQAQAFAAATEQNSVATYAQAVASAISQGGSSASQAYSQAFAQAISQGGSAASGLAQATAVVFCQGGASAEAYAQALSLAISQDPKTGRRTVVLLLLLLQGPVSCCLRRSGWCQQQPEHVVGGCWPLCTGQCMHVDAS